MDRSRAKKASRPSIVVLVIGLAIWVLVLSIGPSTVKVPTRSVPSDSNSLPTPSPSESPGVPTPRSEREPHKSTSPVVTIYVVNSGISEKWHLATAIAGWNKARWTKLSIVPSCPVAEPCVVIREDKKIDPRYDGETLFRNDGSITIRLNPVVNNLIEAQNTICHEFGHVLGAPHIKGTHNTCMAAIDVYRVLPSSLDLSVVDGLGRWEFEKMYQSSGKDLDVAGFHK